MKLPDPVAWMYDFVWPDDGAAAKDWVTQNQNDLDADAFHVSNVRPLFTEAQMREVINSAAQICQRWIDDHSKSDNCTYNDCDMVAAVTDVMNEIKGMMK